MAAAVVLDPRRIPKGLDDSKRLTAVEREALFVEIAKRALAIAVASVSATGIDGTDIRKASLEAMRRACAALTMAPAHVIVDGRDKVPGLSCACTAVVKGDQRSQSVAAASIVAKVMRDRMMRRCAEQHPHYGFEMHVGYATRTHRDAISAHGAVERLHRLSFSPFRLDGEEAESDLAELGLLAL